MGTRQLVTVEQIIGQVLGSSGVAAVMYLWVRYLIEQVKTRDTQNTALQGKVLQLAEQQAETAIVVRERLRNIEYALRLRKTLTDDPVTERPA